MNVSEAVTGAIRRVKLATAAHRWELKLAHLFASTKMFNLQRGHPHPATMSATRRRKLRRG